jgi:hypothetical protein
MGVENFSVFQAQAYNVDDALGTNTFETSGTCKMIMSIDGWHRWDHGIIALLWVIGC